MNKPLTVKQLYKECKKLIDAGKGDKIIMISRDDEGNGYHYLWYSFTPAEDILDDPYGYMESDFDKNIAEMDDTIILG